MHYKHNDVHSHIFANASIADNVTEGFKLKEFR